MTNDLATTSSVIQALESPKMQQSLKQYFDRDDTGQKRFTQVVIRAVQENPDLLLADRASLFLACQTAAQDGLLPDRKEGALVVYNTKVNNTFVKKVQWQPMIGGLRKKLANHGFSLRAEIVYEHDQFLYEMGDEPRIVHKPEVFGNRGEIRGAYAIAEAQDGAKYRETMTVEELEKVRAASRNASSGPWATWTTEMYRKTVAKRLFKQLPLISPDLADLIDRDNEEYEIVGKPGVSSIAKEVQQQVRAAPIEGTVEPKKRGPRKAAPPPAEEPEPAPDIGPEPPEYEDDPLA